METESEEGERECVGRKDLSVCLFDGSILWNQAMTIQWHVCYVKAP